MNHFLVVTLKTKTIRKLETTKKIAKKNRTAVKFISDFSSEAFFLTSNPLLRRADCLVEYKVEFMKNDSETTFFRFKTSNHPAFREKYKMAQAFQLYPNNVKPFLSLAKCVEL